MPPLTYTELDSTDLKISMVWVEWQASTRVCVPKCLHSSGNLVVLSRKCCNACQCESFGQLITASGKADTGEGSVNVYSAMPFEYCKRS